MISLGDDSGMDGLKNGEVSKTAIEKKGRNCGLTYKAIWSSSMVVSPSQMAVNHQALGGIWWDLSSVNFRVPFGY